MTQQQQREAMVRTQLEARGIVSPRVLEAMADVPRERFVPPPLRSDAYADRALPLDGATISQPYIVAYMTELADVQPGARVLEIGTGSGYQAAVLAELGAEVFTVELRGGLAREARARLGDLGYSGVKVRSGNGYWGWPEHAPFDAIVLTAAPTSVPAPLLEQLADGGRLVAPVGRTMRQTIVLCTREGDEIRKQHLAPVAFVPFVSPTAANH